MNKICYITAIYGNYEKTCKKYVEQSIKSDFICFTDNKNIISNGWIIDDYPYHLKNNLLDNNKYHNSISNNQHTFNIAKFYKQSFYNIPRLKIYDVIVWLDGTIEIIYKDTSKYILDNIAAQNKKDQAIEKAGQEADAARAKAQFDNAVAQTRLHTVRFLNT